MQLRQNSTMVWSCPHQMYLQADLSYEVTQERGYCVARLRAVELLKPPPMVCVHWTPRRIRANVIPFPKPKGVSQLAKAQLQGSLETREQSTGTGGFPDETVAAFSTVLAALSNE